MSHACIRLTDGENGAVNAVIEYSPSYSADIASHLIVAQLQMHMAAVIMKGADSSDPVNLSVDAMTALKADFPAGDWTIEQATEYEQRLGAKVQAHQPIALSTPSKARLSSVAAAVLGPPNG